MECNGLAEGLFGLGESGIRESCAAEEAPGFGVIGIGTEDGERDPLGAAGSPEGERGPGKREILRRIRHRDSPFAGEDLAGNRPYSPLDVSGIGEFREIDNRSRLEAGIDRAEGIAMVREVPQGRGAEGHRRRGRAGSQGGRRPMPSKRSPSRRASPGLGPRARHPAIRAVGREGADGLLADDDHRDHHDGRRRYLDDLDERHGRVDDGVVNLDIRRLDDRDAGRRDGGRISSRLRSARRGISTGATRSTPRGRSRIGGPARRRSPSASTSTRRPRRRSTRTRS